MQARKNLGLYYAEDEMVTDIPTAQYSLSDLYGLAYQIDGTPVFQINPALQYVVYADGKKYECSPKISNGSYFIGNIGILGLGGDDTGEPFAVIEDQGPIYTNAVEKQNVSFGVTHVDTKYSAIDINYIPEGIQRTGYTPDYVIAYGEDGTPNVKGITFKDLFAKLNAKENVVGLHIYGGTSSVVTYTSAGARDIYFRWVNSNGVAYEGIWNSDGTFEVSEAYPQRFYMIDVSRKHKYEVTIEEGAFKLTEVTE